MAPLVHRALRLPLHRARDNYRVAPLPSDVGRVPGREIRGCTTKSTARTKVKHLMRRSNSNLRELLPFGFCLLGGFADFQRDIPRSKPNPDLL